MAAAGPGVHDFAVGDRVIAMTGGSWAQRVRVDHRLVLPVPGNLSGDAGVDIVIDIIGARTVQDNTDAAAVAGRVVCLGRLAGPDREFNLDEFPRKRIQMIGVTFRTRLFDVRVAAVTRFREEMLGSLSSGALRPVIDRSFSFREIEQAQPYMRENHNFRKVVVEIEPS